MTHDVTVWVGHQSGYPASFLCLDNPTVGGKPIVPNVYRLEKASASAPWRVSSQLLPTTPSALPSLAVDGDGYAQVISSDRYGKFLASPASLSRDYAAYLTAGNSADDHEFAPGNMTSALIDNTNKAIRTAAQDHTQTVTTAWSPTGDPISVYLQNDGTAFVVLGIRSTTQIVAKSGAITVTKDGKGITGPAPGKYRDTTSVSILLVGFAVPAKGSNDRVAAVAAYGGTVSSTGTPV
jgi:hypothetical protein